MIARDWLKTLFYASYKGVPFWVARDAETGGRRIVVHEFPMRDDPYLEDLGEAKREFEVTAYVASNNADGEAGSLVSTCTQRGAGVLVLPTHGPILVRCLEASRERSLDRHGYIGFTLKFTREGFGNSLASIASLANMIFVGADQMTGSLAGMVGRTMSAIGQSDVVEQAAMGGLQTSVSTFEALRSGVPVDVNVSAAQRLAIETAYADAGRVGEEIEPETMALASGVPVEVTTQTERSAVQISEIARGLVAGIEPRTAIAELSEFISMTELRTMPAIFRTPSGRIELVNEETATMLTRLAALQAYCEAIARVVLSDRPSAITLRANVSEFFEATLEALPASELALFQAATVLRDATVRYLSRSILDLAPVLGISANRSMPSLYWSWRMYGSPERSSELVARNRVPHPSFMPQAFEALAR